MPLTWMRISPSGFHGGGNRQVLRGHLLLRLQRYWRRSHTSRQWLPRVQGAGRPLSARFPHPTSIVSVSLFVRVLCRPVERRLKPPSLCLFLSSPAQAFLKFQSTCIVCRFCHMILFVLSVAVPSDDRISRPFAAMTMWYSVRHNSLH